MRTPTVRHAHVPIVDPGDLDASLPVPERAPPPPLPELAPPRPRGVVASPLDGAFSGKLAQAKPAAPPWTRPVLGPGTLDEANEKRLLKDSGGRAVLAAYGGFDPAKKPVVLVHGIDGSPKDLAEVAARLHAAGRQVFIACYDDRRTLTSDSALQLATVLQRVREDHYAEGTPLDLVAHSMGGIVTRAALNFLERPGWLGTENRLDAEPRAGFGDVRLRTLDTAWDGFQHEPKGLGKLFGALAKALMTLFGWRAAYEMRGSSELYEKLYEPPLRGVEVQSTAAHQVGKQDSIRALPDLSKKELAQVARFVMDGADPRIPRARNAAGGLAQDSRWHELQREVRAAVAGGAEPGAALVSAYEKVMPRLTGTHEGILHGSGLDPLIGELSR